MDFADYSALKLAFPRDLDVDNALALIPPMKPKEGAISGTSCAYFLNVPPEREKDDWWMEFCSSVLIPGRIYFKEPALSVMRALDVRDRLILSCVYTRHHDGFIREKHLRELIKYDWPQWAFPFVVRLSSEYVLEIIDLLYEHLRDKDNTALRAFCAQNPQEMQLAFARMASYWNEYYRSRYPKFRKYVGRALFRECFGYR